MRYLAQMNRPHLLQKNDMPLIKITEFMAEPRYSLYADSVIVDSLKIFKNRLIPSAHECDGSKPIGIVHIHDLIQRGLL